MIKECQICRKLRPVMTFYGDLPICPDCILDRLFNDLVKRLTFCFFWVTVGSVVLYKILRKVKKIQWT